MPSPKYLDWNSDKNDLLKDVRGIGFEDIVTAIAEGRVLDVLAHHNSKKYPNQFVYIVEIDNYCYAVPFVEETDFIFLKTIFPSRKYTKNYLRKEQS